MLIHENVKRVMDIIQDEANLWHLSANDEQGYCVVRNTPANEDQSQYTFTKYQLGANSVAAKDMFRMLLKLKAAERIIAAFGL